MSLWAMDVEGENARFILPPFRRETGLKVDLQWLPWTAAHQKLLTAFTGDGLPDVVMLSSQWIGEFAGLRAIRPLAGLDGLLSDQFPAALRAIEPSGPVFAAPWDVDTSVQYYRRDLLAAAGYDAPPAVLEEWRRMLRAVKRRAPDRFGVLMQLNWPDHLIALAAQQPEPLLRDGQSRGNFRSEGFKAALAFYASLFAEGLAPMVTSIEADDPVAELARGFVAIYPAGAWIRAELRRRPAELPPRLWNVAPMPGTSGPGASAISGACLAVSRTARDPGGAMRLIDYLCQADTQARFFRIAGVLPSRASAWRLPAIASDPHTAVFAGQIARARPLPTVYEWPRIATEMQVAAERLVRGQLTLDQATVEMDRSADALLAKRRWLLDRGRVT